jgi:hypothetical protein
MIFRVFSTISRNLSLSIGGVANKKHDFVSKFLFIPIVGSFLPLFFFFFFPSKFLRFPRASSNLQNVGSHQQFFFFVIFFIFSHWGEELRFRIPTPTPPKK